MSVMHDIWTQALTSPGAEVSLLKTTRNKINASTFTIRK